MGESGMDTTAELERLRCTQAELQVRLRELSVDVVEFIDKNSVRYT